MKNPKKNSEGYSDLTAYYGTLDIVNTERECEQMIGQLVKHIKFIASLAGFEVVGRITFKHKKSGKLFR